MNNKEKLIQDNYSKVNQISARCMRVIVAILALAFVYCYFGTDMDESVLIVFFASAIFIALIPTLIINILKFDHAPVTKHIVIICVSLVALILPFNLVIILSLVIISVFSQLPAYKVHVLLYTVIHRPVQVPV